MKKLILSAAIVLGGLTAVNAQSEETALNIQAKSEVQAQVEDQLDAAEEVSADAMQDYKEIKTSEVPQAILANLSDAYDGAAVSKAYVNQHGEYKLELTTADNKTATVYTNEKGEVVKNELDKQ